MVRYQENADGVTQAQLIGFFEGWLDRPSPAVHAAILHGSDEVILAIDDDCARVVGFATAITDKTVAAYIPFLEVLPEYRGRGIGRELVSRLLRRLAAFYMIDLTCDPGLQPFYAKLGMRPATGMMVRDFDRQSGSTSG